jgi:tetratricopeptide (TPR) repeat protein
LYDAFLSYHHADQELARRLLASLRAVGLEVYFDEDSLEDFASISEQLTAGVARSKALLALYSTTYPTRRACQFELTAAFLAGQREGDPRSRVLVVNPSSAVSHIDPVEIRDALFRSLPAGADEATVAATARAVADHVVHLEGVLGDIQPLEMATWRGRRPVASPAFVGRIPDFWKIHGALQAAHLQPITGARGPGLAQIVGMPGIGKTMLAEEYALRFAAAYPGGIFWLDARGSSEGERVKGDKARQFGAERSLQLRELAAELAIPAEALADPASAEIALVQELESRGQAHLWIVDDLPAGLKSEELRSWLAPHRLGKTLLITRGRDYESMAPLVDPGALPPKEALQLLTQRRSPIGADESEEAERLAEDLGFHALALAVASAAIAAGAENPYRSFRAELNEEDDDALEFAAELTELLPTGHHPSIARALLSSIRRLDPAGLDLLRLASKLSSSPIPPTLVDEVLTTVDNLSPADGRHRGMEGRAEVHRSSLADRVAEGWSLSVHPLVSRTIRFAERADPTRTHELEEAATAVFIQLLQQEEEGSHPLLDERLATHARHLALAGAQPELQLLSLVAGYDHERGAAASAAELFEKAVEQSSSQLGEDHLETLRLVELLGTSHRILGSLETALRLQEQVVAGRRSALGPGHPLTLDALVALGSVRYARGEVEQAQRIEEEVLALRLQDPGKDHPDTLDTMENLALTVRALGDLDRARGLQIEVLKGRLELWGEKHRHTLAAIANLAWTYHLQGQFDRARQLEERVLVGRLDLFGPDHVETLKAMGNLGSTFESLQDLDKALSLTARMVEGQRKLLRTPHPDTLRGMINLAGILSKRGDTVGARTLREAVVSGRAAILGPQHPDTLRAASALAESMLEQGELDEAHELQEVVLAVQLERLGEDHLDVASTLESLATTMYKLNDQESALNLQERAWAIRKKLLGESHPATLFSLQGVGELQGDEDKSAVDEMARILTQKILEDQPNNTRDKPSGS